MKNKIEKLNELLQLIDNQLTVANSAKWGLMKAQNMVEHLSLILTVATEKWGNDFNGDGERTAKMKANFFGVKYPFPKSVPIPNQKQEVPSLRCETMVVSKALLQKSFKAFLNHYKDHPNEKVQHPYFGMLSFEEWLHFQTKHFEHHAMQFGLLPYPLTEEMEQLLQQIDRKLQLVYSNLNENNQAKWGLMNAHQCIEHLALVIIYSTGKFGVPFKGNEVEAKKLWKPFVATPDPWKTIFPTYKELGLPKRVRNETIEGSKKALKRAFVKYKHYVMENPDAITPHGFLGNISTTQWLLVHAKHIDHHLSQFGVVEALV